MNRAAIKVQSRDKIFVLGIGAQKAGTSWLHKQLCTSPYFEPGFTKEYHIFDSLYSPVCKNIRARLLDSTERAIKMIDGTKAHPSKPSQHAKRLSFIESTDNYFEYFDYLWLSKANINSTGDITPSYSTLDAKSFEIIREGLSRKGFQPKVVFLMRDPIERIWSMLRMEWRNSCQHVEFEEAMQRLLTCHRQPGVKLRTQYDRTITELEKVFPADEIYYGFYENLFKEKHFKTLTEFLGIEIPTPNFEQSVNASPKGKIQNAEQSIATEIVSTYSSVYCFIRERFGDQIMDLWPSYKYLN